VFFKDLFLSDVTDWRERSCGVGRVEGGGRKAERWNGDGLDRGLHGWARMLGGEMKPDGGRFRGRET